MAKFHIIECTKKGFIKTWEEKKTLLRLSLPAIIISAIGFFFFNKSLVFNEEADVENGEPTFSFIDGPDIYIAGGMIIFGIILISYVLVKQSRLILLGNNIDQQANDDEAVQIKRTIILASLFFVGFFIIKHIIDQFFILALHALEGSSPWLLSLLGALNIVWIIWFLRFSVAHIPVSINYSFKDFLYAVRGFQFSFYLLGLIAAVIIPYSLLSFILFSIIKEITTLISETGANYILALLFSVSYIFGFLVFNAASVYALDQVMKQQNQSP